MSDFYKVLKADPLGDPWTPNQPGAKPIQNYWCQVEGQALAVSIGKQARDDGQPALTPGTHVYGDLMYAKSQKGTEYWKFKSVKVPEGVQRPADSPAQAQAQAATGSTPAPNMSEQMPGWFMPVANQIDYIWREMRKMDTSQQEQTPAQLPFEPAPKAEPVDAETQAKIDELFNVEEEPKV